MVELQTFTTCYNDDCHICLPARLSSAERVVKSGTALYIYRI